MTHLAAGKRLRLAVNVQTRARLGGKTWPGRDLVADEIVHDHVGMTGGIAERPAAYCANVLAELR